MLMEQKWPPASGHTEKTVFEKTRCHQHPLIGPLETQKSAPVQPCLAGHGAAMSHRGRPPVLSPLHSLLPAPLVSPRGSRTMLLPCPPPSRRLWPSVTPEWKPESSRRPRGSARPQLACPHPRPRPCSNITSSAAPPPHPQTVFP